MSKILSPAESEQTDKCHLTDDALAFSAWARVILLIKENQLATAAVLFCAWQAGIFIQAYATVQGMCGA